MPFELVIERICKIYHKLPSEVLEEDWDWIEILLYINKYDLERQEIEQRRAKMKQEIKNGSR